MKKRLFILSWCFSYGSASSNRLLAYANSAAQMGVEPHIVALLRIDVKDYLPNNMVFVDNLYPCKIRHKGFAFFISVFTTIWFLISKVQKNDRILLYGASEYLPLCLLFRRKQTFFEITECPDLFHPRTYPNVIYKKLWKLLHGVVVISSNLKQYFVEHGVRPDRITIINMIADSSRFENLSPMPVEKYIAYCGNINKDNKDGVFDLIRSFVKYYEIFNDRKLYIIGPIVSKVEKEKYIEYLRLSKAEDAVFFVGSVSPSEIPQLLVNAEMLVLTRPNNVQARYGFATKIGEYLLSRRPNVLTNVGNISDFLTDGDNAYIAMPEDIDSIAGKMIEVSSNPLRANQVGLRGRETALTYFNSNIETEKLINIMYKNPPYAHNNDCL